MRHTRQSLTDYTDAELQHELTVRKQNREEEEQRQRKAREITVVCPLCKGTGEQPPGYGDEGYPRKCSMCETTGKITALRAT